ncbi:MAG: putative nucleic acid-binding Zn-ribbon protein [Hyphomicrobiaceae bacterium]|jgi:predicted  nucleic acid-binding Zn-ribbon protein
MSTPLSSKLEILFKLQQLDLDLRDKVLEVDRFESALAERRREMQVLQTRINEVAARRKVAITERALTERRMEEQGELLKDRRQRGGRVRTEKELRASQDEVSNLSGELSEVETRMLELMQSIEEFDGRLAKEREIHKQLEEADHRHITDETERVEGLRVEIAAERADRNSAASAVDASLRRRYDMILEQRQGVAVVQVIDGNCGGCNLAIPPQLLIEIMKSGAVKACQSCQRIIYVQVPPPEGTEPADS